MAIEIRMPSLAESMTEGTLSRWLKKVGQTVVAGEAIAEVESDKATVALEAPRDGVIQQVLVEEGTEGVKVGTLIALLVGAEDGASPGSIRGGHPGEGNAGTRPATGVDEQAARQSPRGEGLRILASPAARRLARDQGVDLETIRGSGPGGRIVMADVQTAAIATDKIHHPLPPVASPAPAPRLEAADIEEVPHSAMSRVAAQRLTEAKQTIPHFYLTFDCALDALFALRQQINSSGQDLKVSVNDLLIKAVAAALRKVPAVNASWSDRAMRRNRRVHVSVAVATRHGLITPIVRDADSKSLRTISAEMKSLAERAREQKLAPHEYQGAGFTISNLGMYGVREFAAIINPPQSCILAVGAGEPRPVVRDGAITVATVMTCTLSADHRVVDGAMGAEFAAAFRDIVEHPLTLLL